MGDDRNLGAHPQPRFLEGAADAEGADHRGDEERRGRIAEGQHVPRAAVAEGLGHLVRTHDAGINRQTAVRQGLFVAGAAAQGEIHRLDPVDQADPAVPEVEQEHGGPAKGRAIVHVEPAIGQGAARGPAMHHEGQADVGQQLDARVVHPRAMYDDAVNAAAGLERAVGGVFAPVVDDREQHLVAGGGIGLARARDEVAEDRVDHLVLGRDRDDVADRHGAPGGQALGAGIGAVVMLPCSGDDALAGRLVHLGIAVQRAAHGGLAQAEILGQLLEIHGCSTACGEPKRFQVGPRLARAAQSVKGVRCRAGRCNCEEHPEIQGEIRTGD